MANTLSLMTNVLRNAVSKQRIRYTENGFNLDLAYICENIIAMGYPAENIEGIYRNRIEDVYQFFEESHRDHYKIYNLCSERNYDISKFHGRVATYPFDDHNPPTIELIQNFCDDVDRWLKVDKRNVAAVHCKAGKGRTGTMICCYLLHSGFTTMADEALAIYDEKRTKDKKGVTIPSQRRYVDYYSRLIRSGRTYERKTVQICEIKFSSPLLMHSQGTVHCSICSLQEPTLTDKVRTLHTFTIDFRKSQTIEINDRCIPLTGDVKVEVYHKVMRKKEKYFHFWFNTYFLIDEADWIGEGEDVKLVYELPKCELDDAHKDKEHKTFAEDFKVQLTFKPVPVRTYLFSNDNCHNNHFVINGPIKNINNKNNHDIHSNKLQNNVHNTFICNNQTTKNGPIFESLQTNNDTKIVTPQLKSIDINNINDEHQQNKQQQQIKKYCNQNFVDINTTITNQQYLKNHNYSNIIEQNDINFDDKINIKKSNSSLNQIECNKKSNNQHKPSISPDISHTNSSNTSSSNSSSSNSISSQASSTADWESGESTYL